MFKVISTFSGIGGSSTGYKMAGFQVLAAVEFLNYQANNYKLNYPDTKLYQSDIRTLNPLDILSDLNLKVGELDILDGSPPCSSFSTAGIISDGWGKVKQYGNTKQRTDDLFYEYIRFLKAMQPKVMVAENVSGITKGVSKGMFNIFINEMRQCGYVVHAKVMNAANYGVPQIRQRTIFIGVRNDLGLNPVYPEPIKNIITVKDVLPNVNYIKFGGFENNWKTANRPSPTLVQSDVSPTAYMSGGQWIIDNLAKKRKLTIDEAKKIHSFPVDYQITGDYKKQWEGIGRAVPPLLMKAIAETIKEKILKTVK